jgi:hypothetical protein
LVHILFINVGSRFIPLVRVFIINVRLGFPISLFGLNGISIEVRIIEPLLCYQMIRTPYQDYCLRPFYTQVQMETADGDQGTTSKDLVQVPIGPVTRARVKKFKDVLNGLIQEL